MQNTNAVEKIFWGIAFPGFPQFLNGKIIKGIVLIAMEILINVQANLNSVIIASFHGDIATAISIANYQWLMFYPCVYLFAIWDGYNDAGGGKEPYSFLPFVFAAFIGTVGVVYSPKFTIFGTLLGPIWLGLLGFIVGIIVGLFIKRALLKNNTVA